MSKSRDDVQAYRGWTWPLGRTRAEEPDSATGPPGPVFETPPPDHPLLQQLHALWISATDESIVAIRQDVARIADNAPDTLRPWVETYLDTFARLEVWLRDG